MRALLVVNPSATGNTGRTAEVLAHALASEVRLEVRETKARAHAEEIARTAVSEGFDAVVALGGDGTVHEVVNGLLAHAPRTGLPALGVVPAGSTNVFARALGLPGSPVEATAVLLDALRADRRRTVGLGRAEGRWFTFNAGLGLDAAVVRGVDRARARGHRATHTRFVRTGVQEFLLHSERRVPLLTLERDGGAPERLALALVCNTSPWTYLGDRSVVPCPRASFETGLDLFGLRSLPLVPTLRHLAQVLSNPPRPAGRRVVQVHDASELVLSARVPLPFQLDGEDLGDRTRVVLHAVRDALQVLV